MCLLFTLIIKLLRASTLFHLFSFHVVITWPAFGDRELPEWIRQSINQSKHLLFVYWVLPISPGTVVTPMLHLLVYKVTSMLQSIQLGAVSPSASPSVLEANSHTSQVCECIKPPVSYPRKIGQLFLVPFSSASHLPHPYTPTKPSTYLELVLLVPPVMLLEAKLQPRSSSWQGRAVSRKLLQGSELMS